MNRYDVDLTLYFVGPRADQSGYDWGYDEDDYDHDYTDCEEEDYEEDEDWEYDYDPYEYDYYELHDPVDSGTVKSGNTGPTA